MNAIEVNNVSMRFNLASENISSLKEYVIKLTKKQLLYHEFYALRDISFNVKKGESVGIVGVNGSGKSTLLKLISGIYPPYKGTILVNGRIVPLIELGAGFDGELTAKENIFLNGAVHGLGRKFMDSKFDEIIDFSELSEFVDVPVKNFSSGMVARLAFAIATIIKPDILICDEVLSVGDIQFQKKCEKKMQYLMDNGTTLLFVSHSVDQVTSICEKAILLEKGRLKLYGDAKSVCESYIGSIKNW